ncbi:hypothetical protein Q8W71_29200 [Methylobacterium sp. NEAU 140]|uniref:hypothetical protein n=1 Tax=Methylobacterium sp. NEAU 140 TaxID=3064945 RepID=UPI002736E79D|nr:hypothetical protein [Methylobacterium sp. NEAU 140]MDP4026688.1 hypothetical protein [Methylobacterium sp. NEAU 140]
MGDDPEFIMARTSNGGGAQPVTAEGFNERIKRLFSDKPNPERAPERRPSARQPRPAKPTTGA